MRSNPAPPLRRKFDFGTHARQTWAIAAAELGVIAKSAAGPVALAIAVIAVLLMPAILGVRGVSVLPGTAQILALLAAPVADNPRFPWVLVPLLIVLYAGQLVWRERDAGINDMYDAAPIPEWAFFLGKFLALTLVLVAFMAYLTLVGVLGQIRLGYFHFEIGLYLRILFGLQLVEYLLFAMLVFVVHVAVNQKHAGYLVSIIAYAVLVFPSAVGLEHHLLIYGSGPRWTYSDMRGFGATLQPWLWFKLYWIAWGMLLAVVGRLLWARGGERGIGSRLRLARGSLTRGTAVVAATALALILALGGFAFYNTNVLNHYRSSSEETARRAEYERRYGKYADVANPTLVSTSLRIEIYPGEGKAEIRGTYVLANTSSTSIDSIHLTTVAAVETGAVSFDRPASTVLVDDDLGYRIYALGEPIQPGESLHLSFVVRSAPRGFGNNGADAFIVRNGSHFTNQAWLPAIGYQQNREIDAAGMRRKYGLARRPAVPRLEDARARLIRVGGEPIMFDAIVGTSGDQVAVAPGLLRSKWTAGGRNYFHYVTDAPTNNEYGVFSARYAVREEQWNPANSSGRPVAIQIYHDPKHGANLDRMVASVRASLDHHTRVFGPYPYSHIRLIEDPLRGMGVGTEAATIEYGEGFSLLSPGNASEEPDAVFTVIAHATARGWWGMQVVPADVEGSGLLGVSLETYSAMRVVEETVGPERLRGYLHSLHDGSDAPRSRAVAPLLRATDSFSFARRGPFALYAMHEYIGKDRVDDALRNLLKKYGSGATRLATSLDLYRELQAVTPGEYQELLRDLFEKKTIWEFATRSATAKQVSGDSWQVTLDVRARKLVVDGAGAQTEAPMNDWVQIGVYGEGRPYMTLHRVRSSEQTITLTVPGKPSRAGIDPENLLPEVDTEDNTREVEIKR